MVLFAGEGCAPKLLFASPNPKDFGAGPPVRPRRSWSVDGRPNVADFGAGVLEVERPNPEVFWKTFPSVPKEGLSKLGTGT